MQLHERTMIVQKAGNEFRDNFLDMIERHNLTYGEVVGILAEELLIVGKMMKREERHPTHPGKRGDEA
jgi:hypothetical protein